MNFVVPENNTASQTLNLYNNEHGNFNNFHCYKCLKIAHKVLFFLNKKKAWNMLLITL